MTRDLISYSYIRSNQLTREYPRIFSQEISGVQIKSTMSMIPPNCYGTVECDEISAGKKIACNTEIDFEPKSRIKIKKETDKNKDDERV